MNLSMPETTLYPSLNGPPPEAQAPIEMTYFGSGIWSYSRAIIGIIVLMTVVHSGRMVVGGVGPGVVLEVAIVGAVLRLSWVASGPEGPRASRVGTAAPAILQRRFGRLPGGSAIAGSGRFKSFKRNENRE